MTFNSLKVMSKMRSSLLQMRCLRELSCITIQFNSIQTHQSADNFQLRPGFCYSNPEFYYLSSIHVIRTTFAFISFI